MKLIANSLLTKYVYIYLTVCKQMIISKLKYSRLIEIFNHLSMCKG